MKKTPRASAASARDARTTTPARKRARTAVSPEAGDPFHLDPIDALEPHERAVIDAALAILEARLARPTSERMSCPELAGTYARLQLAGRGRESFAVFFLDAQHRVIAFEEVSTGTLTHTSVYPREIVRRALKHNASAVILAHNHPSGVAEPSQADIHLTNTLRRALEFIDVRVLDHVIVGDGNPASFAARGLL